MRRLALAAAVVATAVFPGVAATARAPLPSMTAPITVVPSAGLPPEVSVDRSNANLAVAMFRGRLFLVFRTAKWQIADDNARLYVVSSTDQVHWRYEGVFRYSRDLREPRFLVWKGHLFLYFALLGSNAAAFEPGGTLATQYAAPGNWTKPTRIIPLDDFIAWSFKLYRGRPYMLGYTGGGGTFQPNPPPKHVYWMTTEDGFSWHAVNSAHPVVYTGQCGETDFAFLPGTGEMVTACQTEEVDSLGWGAKVCTAPAAATWQWTCRGDPRRLDSPYVFVDSGHAYVIARRQPNFGGNYDLAMTNLPDTDAQFAAYDGAYAATTKRCALWSIDPATRGFEPLVDVPGTGDTCYPEIIEQPDHHYLVYNYTSPLDTDPPWGTALTEGTTLIYRHTLVFPSSGSAGTCLSRRSAIGPRNIGRIRLGYTRRLLLRIPVAPLRRTRYSFRYCVKGRGGRVGAVFSGRARGARVELVATTARGHGNRGVRVRSPARTFARGYPRRQRIATGLYRAGPHSPRLIGLRDGRVRFIAVARLRLVHRPRLLRRDLRRAGL
jgi:hypothetical protein